MGQAVFKVLAPGFTATLQDQGRPGWRRFGVPPSGAADGHAATLANRLLGNTPWAPVLEVALNGTKLQALCSTWITLTGADAGTLLPRWRTIKVEEGDIIHFAHVIDGVWSYLAVEDGFLSPLCLDSASVWSAAGFGTVLKEGDILYKNVGPGLQLPRGVAARSAMGSDQRTYAQPPALRVHPGPQWEDFSLEARAELFSQVWHISSKSNRVGYRLQGQALAVPKHQLISEPTPLGSIQVPENGQPIVLLCDGPVVGGYHKIGIIEPEDLSWLVQCQPGSVVKFVPAGSTHPANQSPS